MLANVADERIADAGDDITQLVGRHRRLREEREECDPREAAD